MTQEEKELILRDICGRLPYGVKCNAFLKQIDGSLKSVFGKFKGYNGWADIGNNLVDIKTVKPYLRPMSSMTEEEDIRRCAFLDDIEGGVEEAIVNYVDWLNAHHFDYRELIPMGLALEATEGMYN